MSRRNTSISPVVLGSVSKALGQPALKKNQNILSNAVSTFSRSITCFCLNLFLEVGSRWQTVCTAQKFIFLMNKSFPERF